MPILRGWRVNMNEKVGSGALLQEINFYDQVLKEPFRVRHGDKYTIISIGPREYFFNRETGEYDGTGYNLEKDG
jgi:hypothetical protein